MDAFLEYLLAHNPLIALFGGTNTVLLAGLVGLAFVVGAFAAYGLQTRGWLWLYLVTAAFVSFGVAVEIKSQLPMYMGYLMPCCTLVAFIGAFGGLGTPAKASKRKTPMSLRLLKLSTYLLATSIFLAYSAGLAQYYTELHWLYTNVNSIAWALIFVLGCTTLVLSIIHGTVASVRRRKEKKNTLEQAAQRKLRAVGNEIKQERHTA